MYIITYEQMKKNENKDNTTYNSSSQTCFLIHTALFQILTFKAKLYVAFTSHIKRQVEIMLF